MLTFFKPKINGVGKIIYSENTIQAGFPSPAEDFKELELDIYQYIIENPTATFFARAKGNSMQGAGILNDDILVIDRSKEAKDGDIVVAVIDSEFTVKRFKKINGKVFLIPENPTFPTIELNDEKDASIWGKVTFVIHKAR